MTQKDAGGAHWTISNLSYEHERGGQALLVHQLLELAKALRVTPTTLLPATISKEDANRPQQLSGEFKALLDRLETPSVRRRSR